MKDEIKEILDDLDYCKNRQCGNILLKYNECDLLLDYITNLQEKNKKLQNRNIELVLERDRLEENNKSMQVEMARTWKIADDYKSRNEKATEYIKNTNFWGIYEDVPMSEVKYGDELLDILEGEDKDVKR